MVCRLYGLALFLYALASRIIEKLTSLEGYANKTILTQEKWFLPSETCLIYKKNWGKEVSVFAID